MEKTREKLIAQTLLKIRYVFVFVFLIQREVALIKKITIVNETRISFVILNEKAFDTFAAVVIALKSQGNNGDPL